MICFLGEENKIVKNKVIDGYRHERPDLCPETIYEGIIMPCWAAEPEDRPTFQDLSRRLEAQHKADEEEEKDPYRNFLAR